MADNLPVSRAMANKWIATELKRINRKQVDLAKHLGVSETVLSKMIHTSRILGAEEERKIRAFLGGGTPYPTNGYAEMHRPSSVQTPDVRHTIPLRTEMPEDVPVLGTALGGAQGGDFTMQGDSGLRVRRPPRLAGRDDVFALFVSGTSMEPRFQSGDLIFLEKKRPPQVNDYVVVELQPDEGGVQAAYVKRLLGITPTKLKLEQYNPPGVVEIDRTIVLQIIRVMTTHDLLGV
jgi:phage repressor protein C with HTH and peptisase S24 domain